MKLDSKGRCCGRKPLVYKKPTHHLFCCKCDRTYNAEGEQIASWSYALQPDGSFVDLYAHQRSSKR